MNLTSKTLPELIALFEQEFPGLGWLIRNDEGGNFFVHLCSHKIGLLPRGEALTFPVWAETPEAAFAEAFQLCLDHHEAMPPTH